MAKIQLAEAIQCLLIPLHDSHLVLPNAAVAEILFFTDIEPVEKTPAWFLGLLRWRNIPVPVISMESAMSETDPPAQHHKQKYAVLKALGDDATFRFFAIRTEGIPRLVRVDKGTISANSEGADLPPFVMKNVVINNNPVIIPDMDVMEKEIKTVLKETVQ